MSYGASAALQVAVYQKLVSDAALSALVEGAIFDTPPAGVLPATHVTLGPENVRDRSDKTGAGSLHELTISVVTSVDSFHRAKTVAGAVCDGLSGPVPPLSRGTLLSIGFLKARARRDEAGQLRRIDLTFRARVQDD